MLEELWSRLLTVLEAQVPASALESWLRPCRLLADGNRLRLLAPNKFTRDWIGQHHVDTIEAAARSMLGVNTQVSIEMDAEPERPSPLAHERIPGASLDDLTPRYTFDTFVVSSSNQFAHAAARRSPSSPRRPTTPSSSTGESASGRPISCTPWAT